MLAGAQVVLAQLVPSRGQGVNVASVHCWQGPQGQGLASLVLDPCMLYMQETKLRPSELTAEVGQAPGWCAGGVGGHRGCSRPFEQCNAVESAHWHQEQRADGMAPAKCRSPHHQRPDGLLSASVMRAPAERVDLPDSPCRQPFLHAYPGTLSLPATGRTGPMQVTAGCDPSIPPHNALLR